ncbi:MAG TPA: SPOR domain-containing protein, partial [bacterium]
EGKELKVRPPAYQADGVQGKQYAVQVLTVPQSRLRHAVEVVKMLLADGQYAYLYRRDFGGKSWYRIRAGFFATPDEAQATGEYILAHYADRKLFKEFWVTVPSQRELRGDLIEYGAQQVKPWVVELPERDNQGKALEDLRALSTEADFAYISQRQDKATSKFAYRTRVGFFNSEKRAQDFIAARKASIAVLGEGKPVKLDGFEETLPGQNLRLGKPVPGEPYTEPPIDHNAAKMTAPAGEAKPAAKAEALKPAAKAEAPAAKKAAAPAKSAAPAATKGSSGVAPFERSAQPQ